MLILSSHPSVLTEVFQYSGTQGRGKEMERETDQERKKWIFSRTSFLSHCSSHQMVLALAANPELKSFFITNRGVIWAIFLSRNKLFWPEILAEGTTAMIILLQSKIKFFLLIILRIYIYSEMRNELRID